MNLPQLIDLVTERIDHKTKRAEGSYVRANTCKTTNNCKYAGTVLGEGIRACKMAACGEDEHESGICYDRKSISCSVFVPRLTPEQLRAKFRRMPDTEIAVRYPSIGSLIWVIRQAQGVPDPTEE